MGITIKVALRKESVDRNGVNFSGSASAGVALRKESVDRNQLLRKEFKNLRLSLSARRAWIEIPAELRRWCEEVVALRKESVDRNSTLPIAPMPSIVALRKESVDRNPRNGRYAQRAGGSLSARRAWIEIAHTIRRLWYLPCRSPQGERG